MAFKCCPCATYRRNGFLLFSGPCSGQRIESPPLQSFDWVRGGGDALGCRAGARSDYKTPRADHLIFDQQTSAIRCPLGGCHPTSVACLLIPTTFIHLITLSARYSTDCGIVKPICLAVFRLITNSNFVGASTGRSAGFVPLRILST